MSDHCSSISHRESPWKLSTPSESTPQDVDKEDRVHSSDWSELAWTGQRVSSRKKKKGDTRPGDGCEKNEHGGNELAATKCGTKSLSLFLPFFSSALFLLPSAPLPLSNVSRGWKNARCIGGDGRDTDFRGQSRGIMQRVSCSVPGRLLCCFFLFL